MTPVDVPAGLPPLVAGLLDARAYRHPVHAPIRVAETHISWVLLTGEIAYKIKKPLRLSFLDYSSAQRRRQFCEEELRLNRRYAPDLYLGVSPITGTVDSPEVDGAGTAIEHAVRMRQFATGDELVALLAAGSVGIDDMAALGRAIARFHATAAAPPADSAYGSSVTVHRVTLDNFAELRRLAESAPWRSEIDRLERQLTGHCRSLSGFMEERRATGWIRECHGDLHCGNVVRWAGTLTPFDGIEFDPALRFIDVVNDVAFLTMDLAERRHPELRRAVLQAWLESLGEFPALPLLPYYEAYRALVRAKVAALRARQVTAPPKHADAIEECRRYLAWAVRRGRPARPALVITCGLSGSGKTSMARVLGTRLLMLHVRSDVERKRLAGLAPLEDSRSAPDAGIYTQAFNALTYERLLACAAGALAAGESIVVDAAFLRRGERAMFLDLAQERSAAAAILHCRAPDTVLRHRVEERSAGRHDASEAGLDVLERQPSFWEPFDAREQPHVVEVDTNVPSAVEDAPGALRRRLEG